MSKKYAILGLLAVMVLASFLRLWQIKTIPPGFYPDEAMNGNNAMEAWEAGHFKIFYPENNGREGLFINIMAPFIAAFGNEPWVPRTIAAIVGILTVLGLYFLTKVLFESERLALMASFFLAASFWHINFSRISFRAIFVPFFLVWSFYFLWRTLAKKADFSSHAFTDKYANVPTANPKEEKSFFSPLIFSVIAGVLFGLGFHTYISFRIAPLLLIIPFILMWKAGQKKLIFIFLIATFIVALPIGIYFLKNPADFFGRTSQLSVTASQTPLRDLGLNILKTIGMFFVRGDYNWRHNFSGVPELWWPVAILFLTGLILYCKNCFCGLFKRLSGKDFCIEKTFLFIWLAVMLLPVVISKEGIPHALRSIAVVPAVMIFAALGLEWLIAKVSNWRREKLGKYPQHFDESLRIKKYLVILLLVFLLAVASNAFNQYFLRWAPNINVYYAFNENYLELGKYLNTLPKNIPKYVIVNADGVDVRGIPMPAQTVMFITKTWPWLPDYSQKNINYITPEKIGPLFIRIVNQKEHLYITMLEIDPLLIQLLKQEIPNLKSDGIFGSVILYR